MKFQTYLIKYGEIGIKGKNRYMFEDALVRQIKHSLKDLDGLFHTYKAQGRVYVDCDGDYDGDEVVEALKRVFGIVGICPVVRVEDKGFEEFRPEEIKIQILRKAVGEPDSAYRPVTEDFDGNPLTESIDENGYFILSTKKCCFRQCFCVGIYNSQASCCKRDRNCLYLQNSGNSFSECR